jgi:hypothetical protein
MNVKVIEYTARADQREANAALIGRVFSELHFAAPKDLAYGVLELDGGRFLHIVATEEGADDALSALPGFKRFLEGAEQRFEGKPVRTPAKVLGAYGALLDMPTSWGAPTPAAG